MLYTGISKYRLYTVTAKHLLYERKENHEKIYLEQNVVLLFLLGNSSRKPGLAEDIFRKYTEKINRIAEKRTNMRVTLARTLDE
jgi:hypothetical protein